MVFRIPFISLALSYFLTYGLFGIDFGYLPLYVKSLGFTPQQISVVTASYFIGTTFFTIPWSYLSDRLGKMKWMVFIALSISSLFSLFLPMVRTFLPFGILFYFYAMFQMVTIPQIEIIAISSCKSIGLAYGRIRIVGTLGVLFSTLFFGWFFEVTSIRLVVYCYMVAAFAQVLISIHLPNVRTPPEWKPTFSQFVRFISQKNIRYFLLSVFLNHMSYGLYFGFLSIWLFDQGFSKSVIGWAWFTAMAAEALVMWIGHYFTNRFRASTLILIGFMATVLRWIMLYYSSALIIVLASQLLNFATFGLFHLASVTYIQTHAPPSLQQSGQALYQAASFGLGAMLGTLLAGQLVPLLGIQSSFSVFIGIAVLAVVTFWPVIKEDRLASL